MTDHIICPCCGEKISISTSKVITAEHFGYVICPKCNGKFTKVPDSINFYIKLHKISLNMLRVSVIVLTIVSLYNIISNDSAVLNYTLFQGALLVLSLILLIAAIVSLFINECNCKRIIRKSRNGFLPIASSGNSKTVIDYIDEDKFYKSQNIKSDTDNSTIENAFILLPKANIVMKMPINSDIEALHIHDTYILQADKQKEYVILADYELNEDHVTLFCKAIGKASGIDRCRIADLMSLESKLIGKVTRSEQAA